MNECRPALDIAQPSVWVRRWLACLPAGSRIIDYACGSGRHTEYALAQGLQVLAVDRDAQAVGSLNPGAERQVSDLEAGAWPFGHRRFDAVVVSNYLFRPRLDLLLNLVAPSGLLIYETFMIGNERFGRPANAHFLLAPNELFDAAIRAGLLPLAFEQGFEPTPKPAMRQRICAQRAPINEQVCRIDGGLG